MLHLTQTYKTADIFTQRKYILVINIQTTGIENKLLLFYIMNLLIT